MSILAFQMPEKVIMEKPMIFMDYSPSNHLKKDMELP